MRRFSGRVRAVRRTGELSGSLERGVSSLSVLPSVTDARSLAQIHARLCAVPQELLQSDPTGHLCALATEVIAHADQRARQSEVALPRQLGGSNGSREIATLCKALKELPAPWRDALLLQRCDYMSYEEIGNRLRVPASVAQRYVALALRQCATRQAESDSSTRR